MLSFCEKVQNCAYNPTKYWVWRYKNPDCTASPQSLYWLAVGLCHQLGWILINVNIILFVHFANVFINLASWLSNNRQRKWNKRFLKCRGFVRSEILLARLIKWLPIFFLKKLLFISRKLDDEKEIVSLISIVGYHKLK